MPSLLMSETDSSDGSTLFHEATQAGNWSNDVPTTMLNTSYFTNTARAGAVK
ncbi:hypothetical protein D3C85_1880500 [compost metagenome]